VLLAATTARKHLGTSMARAGRHRAIRTVPADRAVQVDLAAPDLTDPADRAVQVDLAVPNPTDPADRADRAVPARGMVTASAATSTAPRGVTDPHPGDRVHHRGRTGTDPSHRPADRGGMAPSTTGATRKTPSGIRSSTSGASTSSESGSRCNESHDARFANRRGGRCASSEVIQQCRGQSPAGDQGAEPHGALAAVRLRRVLCSPLLTEHRRDHRPDSTDVLRRLLPHGNKKSGRAAARCGDKPVHRTR
jgi:hypothetical protein